MSTIISERYMFFYFCLGGEMKEAEYQAALIPRIIHRFYGPKVCRVQINDPNMPGQQGIPDLTVFVGPFWSLLEVKASAKSKIRPNQQYWIDHWGQYTFCSFIYPENEEEVLLALQQSLGSGGTTRVPWCQ